jgi:heterodisulfide reductase subunit A
MNALENEKVTSDPSNSNSILVIGGGMAGMYAALDIANQGYTAFLVEQKESIGGRYSQIYKIFPTDECSA